MKTRSKIILIIVILFNVSSKAQKNLDLAISESIKKYFTTGPYYLKDTIKPISILYKQINDQLNLKYITTAINPENRLRLYLSERRCISSALTESYAWARKPDTLCALISSEGVCKILDSITNLSTKIEYNYSENKITQNEYDSLKLTFPYIIYISKPLPIRRKKYLIVGFTSIGGGLMNNPCHIIIFKKQGEEFKEYINVNCK